MLNFNGRKKLVSFVCLILILVQSTPIFASQNVRVTDFVSSETVGFNEYVRSENTQRMSGLKVKLLSKMIDRVVQKLNKMQDSEFEQNRIRIIQSISKFSTLKKGPNVFGDSLDGSEAMMQDPMTKTLAVQVVSAPTLTKSALIKIVEQVKSDLMQFEISSKSSFSLIPQAHAQSFEVIFAGMFLGLMIIYGICCSLAGR